jgi:hypothetical protein
MQIPQRVPHGWIRPYTRLSRFIWQHMFNVMGIRPKTEVTRSTKRVFSSFRCSSSCRTNEAVCRSSSNTDAIGSPFSCSFHALFAAHGNQQEVSKTGASLTTRKLALDKDKPKAMADYEDRFEHGLLAAVRGRFLAEFDIS